MSLFEPSRRGIHTDIVNKYVREFTLNSRPWSAFPIQNVEIILRHYGKISKHEHYAFFDPDTESLVFQTPPDIATADMIIVDADNLPELPPLPKKWLPPGEESK